VGPLFFEKTITVKNNPIFFIALQEENKQNCWFQQSGATAHTMKITTALLQAFFSDCTVRYGLWPP